MKKTSWIDIEGREAFEYLMSINFPKTGEYDKDGNEKRVSPYELTDVRDREMVDYVMVYIFKYAKERIRRKNFNGQKDDPGIDEIVDMVMTAYEENALISFRYSERSVAAPCFIAHIRTICDYKCADWNRVNRGDRPNTISIDDSYDDEDDIGGIDIPDITYSPEKVTFTRVNAILQYYDIIHYALMLRKFTENGESVNISLPIRVLYVISRVNGYVREEYSISNQYYASDSDNQYSIDDITGKTYAEVRNYLVKTISDVFQSDIIKTDWDYILEGFDDDVEKRQLENKVFNIPKANTVKTTYARLNKRVPKFIKEMLMEETAIIK